jgi:hypothetical protein
VADRPEFELRFLADLSEESLVEELRRVAETVPDGSLTEASFREHSRVSPSTVKRRLGGWRSALERAGLSHRYSGRVVTAAMRKQAFKTISNEELLNLLRGLAASLGRTSLAQEDLRGSGFSPRIFASRFGSFGSALEAAGLSLTRLGRRYSQETYLQNVMDVWTFRGRQPLLREMDEPPSTISSGAYEWRFGGWRKALTAFVEWANSDQDENVSAVSEGTKKVATVLASTPPARMPRSVPDRLRWRVFERDRFSCVACGRSRAKGDDIKLHADHKVPWSKGGPTTVENLQTLCEDCNLGKGDLLARE